MTTTTITNSEEIKKPSNLSLRLGYIRRNPGLALGVAILISLILFTVIGLMNIDSDDAYPLSVMGRQAPSIEFPFGTDYFGRDLYAALVVGMWQTALIGVIAGAIGTFIGIILGFVSAFYGGILDTIIKGVCQILMPIPVFLIQVIIAGSLNKDDVTVFTMALIVVLLAWMWPTLVIRSQVLSMKERQFVSVAKLSGMNNIEIIFAEIFPNLLPFIAASFVWSVFSAVFASFYLAVIGLGPLREPLLGNIIWGAQSQGAFFNGWWWWPLAPATLMVLILTSLALINMGLDELANPRVRRTE
ncbi:MAG: ABC transporter permease [Chloroflexi bacterium]|nr:ABC transporter permease [Chloroflexota bacterium]